VIHGCYGPSGGLRVVTSSTDCRSPETAISWNQQGKQGEPGPQGKPGLAGPSGVAAACTPDLSSAPGAQSGATQSAFLKVGGVLYPVTRFQVGGIGCPAPVSMISVAEVPATGTAGSSGLVPLATLPLEAFLTRSGSFDGSLETYDTTGVRQLVLGFTDAKVTSFLYDGDMVQMTLTAGSISQSR
jgi:hypothetical protein